MTSRRGKAHYLPGFGPPEELGSTAVANNADGEVKSVVLALQRCWKTQHNKMNKWNEATMLRPRISFFSLFRYKSVSVY